MNTFDNPLWKKVYVETRWDRFIYDDYEIISDSEISRIKKLLSDLAMPKSLDKFEVNSGRLVIDVRFSNLLYISIIKKIDEWWFVRHSSGYYKCDTIEGLEEVLIELYIKYCTIQYKPSFLK